MPRRPSLPISHSLGSPPLSPIKWLSPPRAHVRGGPGGYLPVEQHGALCRHLRPGCRHIQRCVCLRAVLVNSLGTQNPKFPWYPKLGTAPLQGLCGRTNLGRYRLRVDFLVLGFSASSLRPLSSREATVDGDILGINVTRNGLLGARSVRRTAAVPACERQRIHLGFGHQHGRPPRRGRCCRLPGAQTLNPHPFEKGSPGLYIPGGTRPN